MGFEKQGSAASLFARTSLVLHKAANKKKSPRCSLLIYTGKVIAAYLNPALRVAHPSVRLQVLLVGVSMFAALNYLLRNCLCCQPMLWGWCPQGGFLCLWPTSHLAGRARE